MIQLYKSDNHAVCRLLLSDVVVHVHTLGPNTNNTVATAQTLTLI